MHNPPPITSKRSRTAHALLMLLIAVLGTLITTTTVASAATLSKPGASSGLAVASVAETRVGVATTPAPLLVAQQSIVSPGQLGQNCPRFLTIVSASCVATKASPCHSFRSDTTVLMADGTRKRISEVEVGDRVLTTDPETGETVVREVTELHVNSDIDMANVTVRDGEGKVSTIYTTQTHQFWSQTDNIWVDAHNLDPGDLLRAFDGSKVTVVGVRTWDGYQTMYDLTIEGVHTYYVTTGNEDVLVHNCNGMLGEYGTQTTSKTLLKQRGRDFRIDVENPAPGVRAGQLHLQDSAGGKYLYDFDAGEFVGMPKSLAARVAADKGVAAAIGKGEALLGVGACPTCTP